MSGWIGFQRKHFVALFARGTRHVAQGFVAAQADPQDLTGFIRSRASRVRTKVIGQVSA